MPRASRCWDTTHVPEVSASRGWLQSVPGVAVLRLSAPLSPARRHLLSVISPCEGSGSDGQEFIHPRGCSAPLPLAGSRVCWRKQPSSAQRCVRRKEREKKKKRSPGVARKLPLRIPSTRFRSRICGAQSIPEVLGSQCWYNLPNRRSS